MSYLNELKRLIDEHRRRLQKLKEQKARLGANTPPETLIEIEDLQKQIKGLQTEYAIAQAETGDFAGHKIMALFNSGLDTGTKFEDVENLYESAEHLAIMQEDTEQAIGLCRRALRILQEAPSRTTGDLNIIPYSRAKFCLLLASIYLNEKRDLKLAKKYYLESKDDFASRKWFHLESLAYLGLAITQRNLKNLDEAIDASYRAQNGIEHESMPETVNTDALQEAIHQERAKIERLLSGVEEKPDEEIGLKVFDIAWGKDIIVSEFTTTDLNLLSCSAYETNVETDIETFNLKQFPQAKIASYALKIGQVDRIDGSLRQGDRILIREINNPEYLSGQKVAVLIMTRTAQGIKTCASLKTFFIGKARRSDRNHYFLQAEGPESPSIIASHFTSSNKLMQDYYAELKKGGPVEEKFVYDLRVSGIVVGIVPASTFKFTPEIRPETSEAPPPELILELPLVSNIAAGVGVIAEENVEEYLRVNKEEYKKATFGVRVVGDSMTGHGIYPGDIALIRQQPTVEIGEIAAVVIETPEAKIGVLKQYYVFDKQADLRHWVLRSSNPQSEHLIVTPSGVDVKAIEDVYVKEIETGQTPIRIKLYKDAELTIAGKYVGSIKQEI